MSSARIHIRLFEEDARYLSELSEVTVCVTPSSAIKMSLQVLEMLWVQKRAGNRVVLRNEALRREHDVSVGNYVSTVKPVLPTTSNFEVRFAAPDRARLESLVQSHAGLNRSHVIREAIAVYAHIAKRLTERWAACVVLLSGERTPFHVPGIRHKAVEPAAAPPQVAPSEAGEAPVLRLVHDNGKSALPQRLTASTKRGLLIIRRLAYADIEAASQKDFSRAERSDLQRGFEFLDALTSKGSPAEVRAKKFGSGS